MNTKEQKLKKLTLRKEQLEQLSHEQTNHFMGGRMLVATSNAAGPSETCSLQLTLCLPTLTVAGSHI